MAREAIDPSDRDEGGLPDARLFGAVDEAACAADVGGSACERFARAGGGGDDGVHTGHGPVQASAGAEVALHRIDVAARVAAEDAGAVARLAQERDHMSA